MHKLLLATIASVTLTMGAAQAQEFEAEALGLTGELGEVVVQRGNQFFTVTQGTRLFDGDIITTTSSSTALLSHNGCEISLSEDSFFEVQKGNFCADDAYSLDCDCLSTQQIADTAPVKEEEAVVMAAAGAAVAADAAAPAAEASDVAPFAVAEAEDEEEVAPFAVASTDTSSSFGASTFGNSSAGATTTASSTTAPAPVIAEVSSTSRGSLLVGSTLFGGAALVQVAAHNLNDDSSSPLSNTSTDAASPS